MTTTTVTKKPATSHSASALAANTLVKDALRLIEDFGNLLVKETEALKKADFRLVDLMQTDKKNFAKKYHEIVTTLSAHKDDVARLDLALRERLVKARTTFTIILADNLRALEISRESSRRLVDRILDTARRTVTEECQTAYSSKAKTQSYKTATLSLNIDQSL